MNADVGRKPCKRNDSFFENAGKPCKSQTMMWIKCRWHLHSHNADDTTPKPAAAMRNHRKNQPPSEDLVDKIAPDSVSNHDAADTSTRLSALAGTVIIALAK